MTSAWVKQEVGFAAAHNKRIWLVAMENDLVPEGFISTIGTYSLFDWSDPNRTIERLVDTLRREAGEAESTFETFGADQVLTDKVQRTKFIENRLRG
jgi:hypothetical protein